MNMEATKRQSDEATQGNPVLSPSSLRRSVRPSLVRPTAFTLTEILIVIGILVLMLALAVPAFNFITGSRSQGAAENVIAAMLGRARAYAIQNQAEAGVAFFVDPASQRTTLALVTRGVAPVTTPNRPPPEDPAR